MLRDWPVMSLILFAVVPNKIMLSGMLFYIVPLLLQKYHLAQATTGQFFLLYYAFLMAGNHFSSRMPDNTLSETWRMSFGVLLSGLGALPLFWFNNPVALGAAVVIFGIGQGICQTPIQISLQKLVQTRLPSVPQQKAIALLRTFERVGGIVGAALAVALSVVVDYRIATAAIGVLTFLMALGTLPLLFNMTDMEKRT
jgi:predicted MFS family arabinose efflux permease